MACEKQKTWKVEFDCSAIKLKRGDRDLLATDWDTVLGAITGAIGTAKCMALGGAVLATYGIGKAIKWLWPSATITDAQENYVMFSVPADKEGKFTDQSTVAKKVEDNIRKNLPQILGEDVNNAHGKEIANIVKSLRIKWSDEPELPQDLKAGQIIRGKKEITKHDAHNFFAVNESVSGIVTETFVDAGGEVKEEVFGGSSLIAYGYEGDDLKALADVHKDKAGNYIPVKIVGDDLSKTFERKFKPTMTLDEIVLALKREEKKFFRIFRDGEELDGEMTLAQAAQTGSTVNWKAELQ